MATFYIDYENVHHSGTTGIDQLSNMEYVFMFYSHNANTMNMETVKRFLGSRCGIEFVEADTGTANSLDFQLITFLYTGISQDDYHYIISKDHGFDAAVKMGNRMGIENVKRFNTIAEALRHYEKYQKEMLEVNSVSNEQIEENIAETSEGQDITESTESVNLAVSKIEEKRRNIVKERIKKMVQKDSNISLPREELEISCDGIRECDNKLNLYHYLRKNLGDKRGRCVYTALNDEFMQLKMDLAG